MRPFPEPLVRYDGRVIEAKRQPEVEWARRLMEGDASAFTPFVESFQSRIFQYSWMMCGQREDAEEVSQETLLKIFQSFDQLRDPENVKSWVFRIARNYCLMKRRKSVFAPDRELSLDELLPDSGQEQERKLQVSDGGELPEERVLRGELGGEIQRALQELPDIYRSVILLRDVEGLSTAETAAVLESSEDVVKQRLHRGRLALRKALAPYLAGAVGERV